MEDNLSLFLRNTADLLDSNQLNSKQLQFIGEFYMSFKFQEDVISKIENSEELKDIEDGDFIKFFILGWYIYCVILKDNNYLNLQNKIKENIYYENIVKDLELTEDKKRSR